MADHDLSRYRIMASYVLIQHKHTIGQHISLFRFTLWLQHVLRTPSSSVPHPVTASLKVTDVMASPTVEMAWMKADVRQERGRSVRGNPNMHLYDSL